jgi:2,4-dienoyl-CoA reductase-like NADH-dependent reductase (Old Yellow Enzyme family)
MPVQMTVDRMTRHPGGRTLGSPLELRCGVSLANRLAKAATSEHLADRHGAPTNQLVEAYRLLASSGVGLLISGNVMVDGAALEAPRNVVIENDRHLKQLRRWAAVTEGTDTKFVLQLSHPGRQTMRGNALPGRRQTVVGPSAVSLAVGGRGVFQTPRALADAGVQIHAAHGYLFNQFLSPLVNHRTDRWGGSLDNRMRLLIETIQTIRARTPRRFLISVKLNSADFQRGGFNADDAVLVARALDQVGIDLLELSGGTYESAAMFVGSQQRDSTIAREAYFLEFAEQVAAEVATPIMLTGGFRSYVAMSAAVRSGAVDVVGLARPITYEPDLPQRLLAGTADRSLVVPNVIGNKTIDNLLDTAWHQQQIARLGRGKPVARKRGARVALAIAALATVRDRALPQLAPK